jgi:osmotically inducible protein OsmC
MPTFSRHVSIDWTGTLMEGSGRARAGSGAFTLPVSFPRRIGEAEGVTSPEELIAAAHGACYARVVAGALGRANASAGGMRVTCTVTADKGEAGIKIVTSKLEVVATGLAGMDAAAFATMAKEAEGKCPVSGALRGSAAIEVDARAE